MKSKTRELILLTLLLIMSSFSLLNIKNLNKQKEELSILQNNIQYNKISYEKLLRTINKNIIAQYESEGAVANNEVILKNGFAESITYRDIIRNKTFIVRIYASGCSICLEEELIKIKQLIKTHEIEKVIYIISHVDYFREFIAFINNNQLSNEKCYFLKDRNALEIPIDSKTPYIYLYFTDPSYEVRNVFVPVSKNNQLSNSYFTFTKELLKEKNDKLTDLMMK